MQSKGNAPSTEQKRFRENLRDLYPGCEMHHCIGTTGKHNKIHIGHWWIIAEPLGHDVEIKNLGHGRKDYEKEVFKRQMLHYFDHYFQMPVPDQVLEAIEDYHL